MSTSTNVGSSSRARSILFILFGVAMLLANAILTAQFGVQFLGGTWGAVLMLLFFDVAAVSWYTARLMSGLSGDQRATAKIMSVATIVGSTLVSVVQVLMMREALSAGLSPLISTAAVWLVTCYAAFNFFALFFFQYASVNERNIEESEELAAQTKDEIIQMRRDAHAKAMNEARRHLMMQTEAIGSRIAYDVQREFLREMDCLHMLPEQPNLPAVSSGAAAGAKEVVKSNPAAEDDASGYAALYNAPFVASGKTCDCGLPLGKGTDECDGTECLIDTKAAEARAARTAGDGAPPPPPPPPAAEHGLELDPIDITAYRPGK